MLSCQVGAVLRCGLLLDSPADDPAIEHRTGPIAVLLASFFFLSSRRSSVHIQDAMDLGIPSVHH